MRGTVEQLGNIGVTYSGGFVQCPECGADAELRIWGEGVDADFDCPECDESEGIR